MKIPTRYKIPKSKDEAKKRGAMYYMDGKPCANGHISTKYLNSGKCLTCNKNNKEKRKFPEDFNRSAAQDVKTRIEALTEKSDFEESWE
jgi:hypothetical protein